MPSCNLPPRQLHLSRVKKAVAFNPTATSKNSQLHKKVPRHGGRQFLLWGLWDEGNCPPTDTKIQSTWHLSVLQQKRVKCFICTEVRWVCVGTVRWLSVSNHRVSHQGPCFSLSIPLPSSPTNHLLHYSPTGALCCWYHLTSLVGPLHFIHSLSRLSVSFYMFYAQWMTPISGALHWCVRQTLFWFAIRS